MKPYWPLLSGAETRTTSFRTVALAPVPVARTAVTSSRDPSGSESFVSTCTDTVRPGLTVASSGFATGLRAPSTGGAMPTRTSPVARAPRASTTV